MRDKGQILSMVLDNADKAGSHAEIELIHGLALLEILIDIRDILAADMKTSIQISKAIAKQPHSFL